MNDGLRLTVSDLFFNICLEGTEKEAQDFLEKYPYFKRVFTAKELTKNFQERL